MKKITTIILFTFLCFTYGYGSNHSMHPLKQINYVKNANQGTTRAVLFSLPAINS